MELLRQSGLSEFSVFKNDEIAIDEAKEFDKIIISPGPATPLESGNILEIISALSPTRSILGICLGHQAIAESFGAKLRNIEHPNHGFQTEIEIINEHKIFSFHQSVKKIKVGLYHSWVVDEKEFPGCLEITSVSVQNRIMSLKHKEFDVHGVQFHPESYMTDYGKEMMEQFLQ